MKCIFLDNDGVICLSNNWGGRFKKFKQFQKDNPDTKFVNDKSIPVEYRFDDFDKKAVKVLNEILEETGAEIIVSSDWKKHATLEELGDYYESKGIIRKPIAVTDLFAHEAVKWVENGFIPKDFPWLKYDSLEQERHFEILHFLKENTQDLNITHWVAIDDLNMGIEIHTRYGDEMREWGLTNFVWTLNESEGIKQCGKKEKIIKFLS
jgi:hypothetical protein